MVDCDLCPIKEECYTERHRILNNTANNWRTYVEDSLPDCPLERAMEECFDRGRVLTVDTIAFGEYE